MKKGYDAHSNAAGLVQASSVHSGQLSVTGEAPGPSCTSRTRVVRIIDRLNIGGPSKHVVWLTAGLNAAGFDTVLITGSTAAGEGDMGYFAKAAGVRPVVIKE